MSTRISRVPRALILLPAAVALAGGVALMPAIAANAAPVSTGTKTVTWAVPAGLGDRYAQPQTLAADASGCGDFQVDSYRYDSASSIAFVDALVARGTLTSAADDGPVFIGHRDVSNVCDSSGKVISTSGSTGPDASAVSSSGDSSSSAGAALSASGTSDPSGTLAFTGSHPMAALAGGGFLAIAAGLVVFGIRRFVVDGR